MHADKKLKQAFFLNLNKSLWRERMELVKDMKFEIGGFGSLKILEIGDSEKHRTATGEVVMNAEQRPKSTGKQVTWGNTTVRQDEKNPHLDRQYLDYEINCESWEQEDGREEFAPVLLMCFVSASGTKKEFKFDPWKADTFTIGGNKKCDMVLKKCKVDTIASITAFGSRFTLSVSDLLVRQYRQVDSRLPKDQLLFELHSSVYLHLLPENSFYLQDEDVLVVKNVNGVIVDIHVSLTDLTERHRKKQNRKVAEKHGLKGDINRSKQDWYSKTGILTEDIELSGHSLTDLILEVRAPSRVQKWNGSTSWSYGESESFLVKNALYDTFEIGSSPSCALSIPDFHMGRSHACVFIRKKEKFFITGLRPYGKKPVYSLIAGSRPVGMDAPSSPPHLLMTSEVFRCGASEFKVVGYSGNSQRIGTQSSRIGSHTPPRIGSHKKSPKIESDDSDEDEEFMDPREDLQGSFQDISFEDLNIELKYHLDTFHHGATSETTNLTLPANVEEELHRTISRMSHEEDPPMMETPPHHDITEEDTPAPNKTEPRWGFARVDEFKDVVKAFDIDTGSGEPFMVIQCIKGPLLRHFFKVGEQECTIGSSSKCSICVGEKDSLISPLHCRIVFNSLDSGWRLIDCHSETGSFLRVCEGDEPLILQPGQQLHLGNTQVRVLAKIKKKKKIFNNRRGSKFMSRHIQSMFNIGSQTRPPEPPAIVREVIQQSDEEAIRKKDSCSIM